MHAVGRIRSGAGFASLVLLGLAFHAPVHAATITVGPAAAIRTPAAVPWRSLQPGDEVVIQAGTYTDGVIIPSKGTADRPILVRGEPGTVIENSVLLEGATHVVIRNLAIRNSVKFPGFILRHGAAFDTIQSSSVEKSGLGIWIGEGAVGGHKLLGNDLHDNRTHGIAVDVVNAPQGQETLIDGNRVYRNVMHGMEINGNRYVIQNNVVWENGTALSGTSGIHVYAKDASQGTGQFNVIRHNVVSGQKETRGQDGNGIQLDKWCDNNQIYFNVAFANDGAGIVLFDAANNLVANNTLFDNMRDSGGRHAYKADLVIASDYTENTDHAFGNVVRNNLIVTERANIRNIHIDKYAAPRMAEIGNNLYFRPAPGEVFFWAGKTGTAIADWNALKPGAPDRVADPLLANLALARTDLAGNRGLIPRPGSPVGGAGIALPVAASRDAQGAPMQALPIGAYLPAP